jgi:transposase-like protein
VRRLSKLDAHVLSLYAHGTTVREIQEHLMEFYHVDIAPDCISAVAAEVLDAVTAWQQRLPEACYVVVLFGAMRV